MEQSLQPSFELFSLRESVLIAVLSGASNLSAIMSVIEQSGEPAEKQVALLLRDPAFGREVEEARARMDQTVIGWARRNGLTYVRRMDRLSADDDPRVAFAATKDLLDRIGTAPSQKVAVSGMEQYKALLKELQPDPQKVLAVEGTE